MRVCIIGGGPSGLVTLKELRERSIDAVVYEARSAIGGCFLSAWEGAQLTSSSVLTAFGSFSDGQEAAPRFWTADEYCAYLRAFAERYDLGKSIRLNARVQSVRRAADGWLMVACAPAGGDGTAPPAEEAFDAIAVCSGTHTEPSLPAWARGGAAGLSEFGGRILHSSEFEHAADFAGRRVLVVGLGESGSDVALLVARTGASTRVGISSRRGPGAVVSRFTDAAESEPADLRTSRALHGPAAWRREDYRWFWHSVLASESGGERERELLRAAFGPQREHEPFSGYERDAMRFNLAGANHPFDRFGTKNDSFLRAMRDHRATLHPDVQRLRRGGVVFCDGSEFECDTIICCTGYRAAFPFFEQHMAELAVRACDARARFKHMIAPEVGPSVAFIGFARPAFGAIPPMSEMSARYWAMLLAGELRLPERGRLEELIARERGAEERQFSRDAKRIDTLTHYHTFMDGLAALIGCRPRLTQLRRERRGVWERAVHSALCGAQYRLFGPGAIEDAWRTMERMPLPRFAQQPHSALRALRARVDGAGATAAAAAAAAAADGDGDVDGGGDGDGDGLAVNAL